MHTSENIVEDETWTFLGLLTALKALIWKKFNYTGRIDDSLGEGEHWSADIQGMPRAFSPVLPAPCKIFQPASLQKSARSSANMYEVKYGVVNKSVNFKQNRIQITARKWDFCSLYLSKKLKKYQCTNYKRNTKFWKETAEFKCLICLFGQIRCQKDIFVRPRMYLFLSNLSYAAVCSAALQYLRIVSRLYWTMD